MYPKPARVVLQSLKDLAEAEVIDQIMDVLTMVPQTPLSVHSRLDEYMVEGRLSTTDIPKHLVDEIKGEIC
jgi:hypothetical protein